MTIESFFPPRWRRKFSLGASMEAIGIFTASITMSSAKKSGKTA